MTRGTRLTLLLGLALLIGCDEARVPEPEADVVNSIGMRFRSIPAGEFLMGAPAWDEVAEPDERPAHKVRLTQPYLLGMYEVTQEQYERVTGTNPSRFCRTGDGRDAIKGLDVRHFPVESVNWFEAERFCELLSELPEEKRAGRRYRLPTEAEWEHAARAGTETRFIWGNEVDFTRANYLGSGYERPRRVGSYTPNAFGLYDMHGNVLEWCSDWHRDEAYRERMTGDEPVIDPTGPDEPLDDVKVLRGGGWKFTPASSSFRDNILPNRRGSAHGLRVVCEVVSDDE